jgi:hypothetical protein
MVIGWPVICVASRGAQSESAGTLFAHPHGTIKFYLAMSGPSRE